MPNTCSPAWSRVAGSKLPTRYRSPFTGESTTRPDGSVQLTRDAVIELLELFEAAGAAGGELSRLRERLLRILNDPAQRMMTIPLREVAAILQSS